MKPGARGIGLLVAVFATMVVSPGRSQWAYAQQPIQAQSDTSTVQGDDIGADTLQDIFNGVTHTHFKLSADNIRQGTKVLQTGRHTLYIYNGKKYLAGKLATR